MWRGFTDWCPSASNARHSSVGWPPGGLKSHPGPYHKSYTQTWSIDLSPVMLGLEAWPRARAKIYGLGLVTFGLGLACLASSSTPKMVLQWYRFQTFGQHPIASWLLLLNCRPLRGRWLLMLILIFNYQNQSFMNDRCGRLKLVVGLGLSAAALLISSSRLQQGSISLTGTVTVGLQPGAPILTNLLGGRPIFWWAICDKIQNSDTSYREF